MPTNLIFDVLLHNVSNLKIWGTSKVQSLNLVYILYQLPTGYFLMAFKGQGHIVMSRSFCKNSKLSAKEVLILEYGYIEDRSQISFNSMSLTI